jgi:uncharacterized protein (DUF1330 family)
MIKERSMAAYVIAEGEALDAELVARYRPLAAASVAKYGGRYLARGAAIETFEGEPSSRRMAIIEFPDMEAAQQWYSSPEYAEGLALSKTAMKRRLILAPGL